MIFLRYYVVLNTKKKMITRIIKSLLVHNNIIITFICMISVNFFTLVYVRHQALIIFLINVKMNLYQDHFHMIIVFFVYLSVNLVSFSFKAQILKVEMINHKGCMITSRKCADDAGCKKLLHVSWYFLYHIVI